MQLFCLRSGFVAALIGLSFAACGGSSSNSDDSSNNGGAGGNADNKAGSGGKGGSGGVAAKGGSGGVASGGSGGTSSGGSAGSASGGSGGVAAGGTGGTAVVAPPAFVTDFENGTVGQGPPTPFSASQVAKVDSEHAFSGTKAIKVTAANGVAAMFSLNPAKYIAANKKTAYLRYMVWMDNLPGVSSNVAGHWDLSKINGNFKGGGFNVNGYLSFGGMSGDNQKLHMFGDDIMGKGRQDCVKPSPFVMKVKEWTCIEMKIDENDILNYGIKIDGEVVQSYSFLYDSAAANCVPDWNIFQGIWYVPEVTIMQLGFAHIHEQPTPVSVWYDDVAVDSKPIGCPKK